VAEYKESY